MLRRLTVSNYQSIADAEIEFGAFTVIVGENGAGKSALLRALGALCWNETGSDFIRKGAKGVSVSVETAEGKRVIWEKDARGARYALEGIGDALDSREFARLGSSVPEEIQQALGIRKIELDATTKLTPQFHEQGDYGFLLRESAGKAARVLAKLTKLDVIVTAQLECRRDLGRAKSESEEAKATGARLETQLAGMPDTKLAAENVQLATSNATELAELVGAAQQALRHEATRQAAIRIAGVKVPSPVQVGAIEDSLDVLFNARRAANTLQSAQNLAQVKLPKEADVTRVAERIAAYEQLSAAALAYRVRGNAVTNAEGLLDEAEAVFTAVKAEWDAAVAELELCETCPLREGIG
jgi:DNA repair ATPase RecN